VYTKITLAAFPVSSQKTQRTLAAPESNGSLACAVAHRNGFGDNWITDLSHGVFNHRKSF